MIIPWILFAVAAAIWALLAYANLWAATQSMRKRRHVSMVPVLGGLAGVFAFFLCPAIAGWSPWWALLPVALDLGSGLTLAAAAIEGLRGLRPKR